MKDQDNKRDKDEKRKRREKLLEFELQTFLILLGEEWGRGERGEEAGGEA